MAEESSNHQSFSLPVAGVEHQLLQPFVGRFRAEVKLWMAPGDPMVTHGTMENSWHLRGLYLHQNYIGDPPPGPFENFLGKGYWGYNFGTRKYEGFWIDTASSIMQVESGTVDTQGTTWTMDSEVLLPPDGRVTRKRSIIRLIDHDHHTMESYFQGADGKDFKSMEITYQRIGD